MKKKIILCLVCLLLVTGCKSVKLTNGENAIVTFKEGGISSDDLYKELKNTYGAETIMNLIDKQLLEKKYEDTAEEKAYVKQAVKNVEDAAKEANANVDLYLNYYYGVKDLDAYKDYLSLSYKRAAWSKEYAKTTVTDKQIEEYYDTEVFGDIEASQILITADIKENATEDEKNAALKDAENKAKEVIKKLKDGEDFAKLAKEYSEDTTTANNGGSLGKVNKDDVVSEVINALRDLKDGTYSTNPVKSTYGYHVLYRTSQDEKPELNDELKETIIDTVGEEVASESGFGAKALKALREDNEMKFVDTDLEKAFNDLLQ